MMGCACYLLATALGSAVEGSIDWCAIHPTIRPVKVDASSTLVSAQIVVPAMEHANK